MKVLIQQLYKKKCGYYPTTSIIESIIRHILQNQQLLNLINEEISKILQYILPERLPERLSERIENILPERIENILPERLSERIENIMVTDYMNSPTVPYSGKRIPFI